MSKEKGEVMATATKKKASDEAVPITAQQEAAEMEDSEELADLLTGDNSRTPMSDEHKAALAEGREQGRIVRRYLEAMEAHKPKRGRKRTAESRTKRLKVIEDQLVTADPLKRLHLVQEKMTLEGELEAEGTTVDLGALEAEFVAAVGPYSRRKGLTFEAWREVGVRADLLIRAGVPR